MSAKVPRSAASASGLPAGQRRYSSRLAASYCSSVSSIRGLSLIAALLSGWSLDLPFPVIAERARPVVLPQPVRPFTLTRLISYPPTAVTLGQPALAAERPVAPAAVPEFIVARMPGPVPVRPVPVEQSPHPASAPPVSAR